MTHAWEALITPEGARIVAPWAGGPHVWTPDRRWALAEFPRVHGWYAFTVRGAKLAQPERAEAPDSGWFAAAQPQVALLVGSRAWPLNGWPAEDVATLPPDLDDFARVRIVRHRDGHIYVVDRLLDEDPDVCARAALAAGLDAIPAASGLTPQHRAAFAVLVDRRRAREAAREARRIARDRAEAVKKDSPAARRYLAAADMGAALAAALRVSGAAILAFRRLPDESVVVDYAVDGQPLQCVVAADTLAVLDAGICLQDHAGYRGDRELSLEALPSVVREAQRTRRLVVFRHVAEDAEEEEW